MWRPLSKQKSIFSGITKENKISNHKSSKNHLSWLYLCLFLSREKRQKFVLVFLLSLYFICSSLFAFIAHNIK